MNGLAVGYEFSTSKHMHLIFRSTRHLRCVHSPPVYTYNNGHTAYIRLHAVFFLSLIFHDNNIRRTKCCFRRRTPQAYFIPEYIFRTMHIICEVCYIICRQRLTSSEFGLQTAKEIDRSTGSWDDAIDRVYARRSSSPAT